MQDSRLEQAEDLYLEGDYDASLDNYVELSQEADFKDNPYLMINLGNTHLKLKNYGKALHCYYKAKAYLPRNKELNNNLNLAIEQTQLAQPALFSYSYMSFFEAFALFLIFNLIFLLRKLYSKNSFLVFLFTILFICSGINFAFISYEQKMKQHAVLTAISAKAYSGDDENYTELFEVLNGQILEVLKRKENWSKVKFNKSLAWIKNENMEFLNE